MTHKQCSSCKETKLLFEFNKRNDSKIGYTSHCKDCISDRMKIYRARRKEKISAYNKEYNKINKKKNSERYRANKDYVSARQKRYYEKNKEYILQRNKQWAEKNKEKSDLMKREYLLRRRARKLSNGVYKVSTSFLKNLYESPCVSCGSKDNIQADHVIPISRGGRHSEGNLQPLCASCNNSKSAKTMMEWKLLQKSAV